MARASDPVLAREVATSIVRRLRDAGHTAYFAGGCVRDALLGLQPTDFDVATDATPPVVRSLFRSTDEVGAAFGVVLVHERGRDGRRVTVEVATFRSDGPYTDARRPDVVHFSDPPADAARRDFTINALFLDPLAPPDTLTPEAADAGGRLIDFVGGLGDLRSGVIRAVGDPDRRLAEDHLRALRAVRFTARLGFRLDPATAEAISRHAAELRGVSRERIGDEMRRMLAHPSRVEAVRLLTELGLDAPVLNEPPAIGRPLTTIAGLEARPLDPPIPLAAWAIDRSAAGVSGLEDAAAGEITRRWRRALCLSNDETEALKAILTGHQRLVRGWPEATVARRKRWAASRWFEPALALVSTAKPELAEAIRAEVRGLGADGIGLDPPPLISGDDLTRAGMVPGPAFRRILEEVYDAQLEGRVSTAAQAMELAARLNV